MTNYNKSRVLRMEQCNKINSVMIRVGFVLLWNYKALNYAFVMTCYMSFHFIDHM